MAEMTLFERRLADALSEYAGPQPLIDHIAVARRAAAAAAAHSTRGWNSRPWFAAAVAACALLAAVALGFAFLKSTFPPAIQVSPTPGLATPVQSSPLAPTASAGTTANPEPTPTPVATPKPTPTIPALPFVSNGGNGPGDYGLIVGPCCYTGAIRGMHWIVNEGGVANEGPSHAAADMGFTADPDCLVREGNADPTAVQIGDLKGVTVFPYKPTYTFAGSVSDASTRAYEIDVDGRTLCVYLTHRESTTAAELAAAEAIVESIRAMPINENSIRVNFTIFEGVWDKG
jgi:hypothetical protein